VRALALLFPLLCFAGPVAAVETKVPELPPSLNAPVAPALTAPSASLDFAQRPGILSPGPISAAIAAPAAVPARAADLALTPALPSRAAVAAPAQPARAAPVAAIAQAASAGARPENLPAAYDGGKPLDVLVVAAEAVPFVKTGGLADVVDAVSRGLVEQGHRVTLVLPNYRNLKKGTLEFTPSHQVSVPMGGRSVELTVQRAEHEGVEIWLLDGALFNARDGPYAHEGKFHEDSDERFIALSHGALLAAKAIGRSPDVVHAHDWHAALIAPLLKLVYKDDPQLGKTKSVYTIHNLAYQGDFAPQTIEKLGLGWEHFTWDGLMHNDRFNFMKAGIQYADAVTTVSRNYAKEIQTPQFGAGLDPLLRYRASRSELHGIVNGIDPALWNPETDPHVARNFGASTADAGKRLNKIELQQKYGLNVDPDAPMYVVASRLDHQKGIDLAAAAPPFVLEQGGQLVVAGSLDPFAPVDELKAAYPTQVYRHGFSETFVRHLFAAADFLLMFSRFEPCGLSQLMAQAYGAIPIVTPTGGLVDTVKDMSRPDGDGIFLSDFSAAAAREALARAQALHQSPGQLSEARQRAMAKVSSWDRAVGEYAALFRRLALGHRG
jgi:starch synthase